MRFRRKGTVLVALVGALLVTGGAVEYLNFSGYCYPHSRRLSDQELIDAAIKYELTHVRGAYELTALSYASPAVFQQENPGCCSLDRSGVHPVLDGKWIRLLGMYTATVHLWYRFQRQGPQQFWSETIFVNSCGRFLERFGHPLRTGLPSIRS
jgi:hypothetical protein